MIRALLIGGVAIVVIYTILILVLPWESRRRVRHLATYALGVCCTIVALIPLVMLVTYLVKAGAPGLGADFFTQVQKPIGEPGSGMKHAIIGSLIIVSLASAIGVPIGILCGIYLAEVGKGKFAAAIRFLSEVMTGLPSIIAGILGFALIVARYERFSAWAGALALSILMIPVVTRVTEEAIRLVPKALREASFGLGAQRWQTVVKVVLPSARSAILTGVILAVARGHPRCGPSRGRDGPAPVHRRRTESGEHRPVTRDGGTPALDLSERQSAVRHKQATCDQWRALPRDLDRVRELRDPLDCGQDPATP